MQTKPDKHPPATLKFGAGSHYTRLDILADMMGSSEKGIRTLLSIFSLPICHFPGMAESHYVLTYAFESALFSLGMPAQIKENAALMRVHQELAGVMYGTLTREALRDRVKLLAKTLTSPEVTTTMGRRRKRSPAAYRTWSGRKPSG